MLVRWEREFWLGDMYLFMYFLLFFYDIIFFFVCGKFKGVYLVIVVNNKKKLFIYLWFKNRN